MNNKVEALIKKYGGMKIKPKTVKIETNDTFITFDGLTTARKRLDNKIKFMEECIANGIKIKDVNVYLDEKLNVITYVKI